jgi:hypothetical protein
MRFRNKAPSPRYMAIYDLEDLLVLKSPAYIAIAGSEFNNYDIVGYTLEQKLKVLNRIAIWALFAISFAIYCACL